MESGISLFASRERPGLIPQTCLIRVLYFYYLPCSALTLTSCLCTSTSYNRPSTVTVMCLLMCRIPPNIRDIVYCTGVSLMDEDVWEFIWMKFHSTGAISEKKILLEALTCSDNTFLLNRSVLYTPHATFHPLTHTHIKMTLQFL